MVFISEFYLSLLIVLAAGMAAGLALLLAARRKKAIRVRIEEYCAGHGYRTEEIKQRLHRATVIAGDGWRLTAGARASDVETQSGSAYTVPYTQWETVPVSETNTPLLWAGTAPGNAALLNNSLLPLLSLFGAADMEGMRAVPLEGALASRFALIARELPALRSAGAELSAMLGDWPASMPLRIALGTGSIRIEIQGKRVDQPRDLDRIIGLGTRCMAYRSSVQSDI